RFVIPLRRLAVTSLFHVGVTDEAVGARLNKKIISFEVFQIKAGYFITSLLQESRSGIKIRQSCGIRYSVFINDVEESEVIAIPVERQIKAVGFEIINRLKHLLLGLDVLILFEILETEVATYQNGDGHQYSDDGLWVAFNPILGVLKFLGDCLRVFYQLVFLFCLLSHYSTFSLRNAEVGAK